MRLAKSYLNQLLSAAEGFDHFLLTARPNLPAKFQDVWLLGRLRHDGCGLVPGVRGHRDQLHDGHVEASGARDMRVFLQMGFENVPDVGDEVITRGHRPVRLCGDRC